MDEHQLFDGVIRSAWRFHFPPRLLATPSTSKSHSPSEALTAEFGIPFRFSSAVSGVVPSAAGPVQRAHFDGHGVRCAIAEKASPIWLTGQLGGLGF